MLTNTMLLRSLELDVTSEDFPESVRRKVSQRVSPGIKNESIRPRRGDCRIAQLGTNVPNLPYFIIVAAS